ncbi:MAG: MOSC domain-containing protein [Terriglobales bacterium]
MKLISINVGRPRLFSSQGFTFKTGIFKKPVSGRVALRWTNLDGDRQADLSVHGGQNKAVYAYPSEHYEFWIERLPGHDFTWGALGENFTTEGLLETEVSIGDRYRVGSAVVKVTTPRLPCYKLAAKFQPDDIVGDFIGSGFCGFYFSVVEEGEVGTGDEFDLLGGESPTITVLEAYRLYLPASRDEEALERGTRVQALPESWRERFQAKLDALHADPGFERNPRVG